VPDTDPVLAIAEHLPRNDERAYGADESERREGRDRDGKGKKSRSSRGILPHQDKMALSLGLDARPDERIQPEVLAVAGPAALF
jgi:hypothetical protein